MKFHRIIRDTGFALALLLLISALGLQAQSAPKASAKPETYFFLVFSDPATGREAEYNKFYDEQHGPDVTSIPGFISGRRYVMADEQLREKLDRIDRVAPEVVVASNPGCLLHMQRGARERGRDFRLVHLVDLLGEAHPVRADAPAHA